MFQCKLAKLVHTIYPSKYGTTCDVNIEILFAVHVLLMILKLWCSPSWTLVPHLTRWNMTSF